MWARGKTEKKGCFQDFPDCVSAFTNRQPMETESQSMLIYPSKPTMAFWGGWGYSLWACTFWWRPVSHVLLSSEHLLGIWALLIGTRGSQSQFWVLISGWPPPRWLQVNCFLHSKVPVLMSSECSPPHLLLLSTVMALYRGFCGPQPSLLLWRCTCSFEPLLSRSEFCLREKAPPAASFFM